MQVLLIEHSRPVAQALRQGLEENGMRVVVAGDVQEGYTRAWEGGDDVIILDLMLPRQGSLSLLERLRQSGMTTPILTLAPPRSPEGCVQSLNRGADDCLPRPFEFQELLARLWAVVRRRSRTRGQILRVHDLEMNLENRTVKRAGRAIELTHREFALLELLVRNRGTVVTRATIRNHFYGDSNSTTSNVVDVFIRYLRAKIDKGARLPLILTQYGRGYLVRGEVPLREASEQTG